MGKRSRKKGIDDKNDSNKASSKKGELVRCVRELAVLTSKNYIEEKNTTITYEKVNKLVSKIIYLEREFCAGAAALSDGPRSKRFLDLIDWVRANGGNVDAVSVAEYPPWGYGLRAECDAEQGSLVCSLPRKVMMIVEEGHTSELAELVKTDPMLKHMSNVALVLFLLVELSKGADSFWSAYIDTLPRSYATVLYLTAAQMAQLKGSPVHEAAMLQNIHIARQYAYFFDLCVKSDNPASQRLQNVFCYELYRWAVSTVLTRQNLIPALDDTSRKVPALIPVWDLCNHSPGPITTGYDSQLACCECFSLHPLVKGQQILISYGSRPNSEFFLHNAFVPDSNTADKYRLHLGLARTDPLRALRSELLTRLALPCGGDFYLRDGAEPVDDDLLAFIRVFCMDKAGLDHWLESTRWNDLKCLDCALETQIETKAWNFLATRISLLLTVYQQLPQDDDANETVQLIRKLVESEKNLLRSAQEYAKLKAEH